MIVCTCECSIVKTNVSAEENGYILPKKNISMARQSIWLKSSCFAFSDFLVFQVSAAVGSWSFILVMGAVLIIWIYINSSFSWAFDAFPFILLNLMLSFIARWIVCDIKDSTQLICFYYINIRSSVYYFPSNLFFCLCQLFNTNHNDEVRTSDDRIIIFVMFYSCFYSHCVLIIWETI